jgi:hypothetical protein
VPQLLTVEELKNKFGKWEISWVKLIDFKDYPALLISNTTITYRALGFDLHFGFFACFTSNYQKTQKRYGYNGNSFVCAVEFGPKIKKSLLAEVTVAIQNQNTLTIKQPCIEKEI